MNSFSDLLSVAQSGSTFRMSRPGEDYIIEIPLKQLSEKVKSQIDEQTPDPIPPSKPGKNPASGKVDAAYPEYAWNDPGYKRKKRANDRKKDILRLEAILPFSIPGTTIEEKYSWIGDRLLGDVLKLRNFVDGEVVNYRKRFNFFTKG
jgi:hypothetical protein